MSNTNPPLPSVLPTDPLNANFIWSRTCTRAEAHVVYAAGRWRSVDALAAYKDTDVGSLPRAALFRMAFDLRGHRGSVVYHDGAPHVPVVAQGEFPDFGDDGMRWLGDDERDIILRAQGFAALDAVAVASGDDRWAVQLTMPSLAEEGCEKHGNLYCDTCLDDEDRAAEQAEAEENLQDELRIIRDRARGALEVWEESGKFGVSNASVAECLRVLEEVAQRPPPPADPLSVIEQMARDEIERVNKLRARGRTMPTSRDTLQQIVTKCQELREELRRGDG